MARHEIESSQTAERQLRNLPETISSGWRGPLPRGTRELPRLRRRLLNPGRKLPVILRCLARALIVLVTKEGH